MSETPYYETMYILRPDIPEEEVDSHLKKYSEILEKSETEVLDSQMRGKRRLAYPIAKHKEGIYVQLSHKGNGQQVATLERAMRLSEDVIRYITVKQDGPLPTPKTTSKEEETERLSPPLLLLPHVTTEPSSLTAAKASAVDDILVTCFVPLISVALA